MAGSAEEAFALMSDASFDLILCDVVMPGMSGLEVLARVRRLWPHTAVVIMTGRGHETEIEAVRLGAAEVLTKPFSIEYVVPLLRRLLKRWPLLKEPP